MAATCSGLSCVTVGRVIMVAMTWPACCGPSNESAPRALAGSPESSADFRIADAATHGVPGLIHLFGIESPGLTSALVIGETVAQHVLAPGR